MADSGSGHRDEEGSIFDLRTVYTLHLKPSLGCIVLLYPKVESSYHHWFWILLFERKVEAGGCLSVKRLHNMHKALNAAKSWGGGEYSLLCVQDGVLSQTAE